jgi:hypothetical protein
VTGGGNLVLQDQGRTVWQTGTTSGVKLVMQNDGHLVLYDAGNGTAWSSRTAGNPGAVLILRAAARDPGSSVLPAAVPSRHRAAAR